MLSRVWTIRFSLAIFISAIVLILSINTNEFLINYINYSFLFGIFFLVISGSYFIISGGFFDIFVRGVKKLLTSSDPYTDNSHWSYEKDEIEREKRYKLLKELFLYIPFFIAAFLILGSLVSLVFYYN